MNPKEKFAHYQGIIPDFDSFLASLEEPRPLCLRINTLLTTPARILPQLSRRGLDLRPTPLGEEFWYVSSPLKVGHLIEHMMGLVYVQALSSGIPVLALNPMPGEVVLDMCAAPGSKTTQMAQAMRNKGLIIANDPDTNRHAALQNNLRRLGVSNTIVTAYDGQNFPMRMKFSKILVDVPCSGEGNAFVARDGSLAGTRPVQRDLSRIQSAILTRAFDILEEGGTLVYSTCTYNPSENEGVLNKLLKSRPARILPIELDIPHDPGITQWKGVHYNEDVKEAWRIYPHRIPTVGFFLAKIGRG
jgi:NOL1/NOP2/sun family putative RNA methylase